MEDGKHTTPQKRIDYLDSISGLLICVMVLWHFQFITERTYSIEHFFFFFLPWFYFKSGMLSDIKKPLQKSLSKWFHSLIIPFVIFSFWGILVYNIQRLLVGDIVLLQSVKTSIHETIILGSCWYNKPVWFLLTLFLCKAITSYTMQYIKPIVLLTIAFIFAYGHSLLYHEYLNFIGNTCLAIICYISGYLLKNIQWNNKLYYIATAIYIVVFLFLPVNIDARGNFVYYGFYPLGVLVSILGCISINNAFKRYEFLNNSVLRWIGRNSLQILVFHFPILRFFGTALRRVDLVMIYPYVYAISWFIIVATLTYLYIIGEKYVKCHKTMDKKMITKY